MSLKIVTDPTSDTTTDTAIGMFTDVIIAWPLLQTRI